MKVASFKLNNKEYVYIIENNKLKYGYEENGNLNTNLTKEEDDMMKYVMTKIFISNDVNNYYKCGKFIHNGKIFQIMFDEISEKKFFYEIVGNEYKHPSTEDSIYLYKRFNSEILYKKSEKKDNNYNKNKNLNEKLLFNFYYLNLIFPVFISSLNYAINEDIFLDFFKHSEYAIVSKFNDELTIIENSLQKNTNLSEEEKDEFRKFYVMVEENKEYINFYSINKRLENTKINYVPDGKDSVSGENNLVTAEISIYKTTSYDDIKKDTNKQSVMSHECCHSFGESSSMGKGLLEAVNEQLRAEYTNDLPNSYYNERMCFYALCELVSVDCFKELKFEGEYKPLINELRKIIDDKELAYELVGNIDCLKVYDLSVPKTEEEKEDLYKKKIDVKSDIYDSISKYFYAKYSYKIEDDDVMMAFLCNSGFLSSKNINNKNASYIDGYVTTNIISKGYFSKEYKKTHPYTFIENTSQFDSKSKDMKYINSKDRKLILEDLKSNNTHRIK